MLLPDKIIPFLTHENALVRERAVTYLAGAHDPSPASADSFWAAIDKLGGKAASAHIAHLHEMPQTETSLQRTLDALKQDSWRPHRDMLTLVIEKLPYGLLLRFRDLVEESAAALPKEAREHITARFELAGTASTDLWEKLVERSEAEEIEVRDLKSERLIEALARCPESAGWAISVLNETKRSDWLTAFSVELLGRMRHRPAVGIIVNRMVEAEDDDDALLEACQSALSRIGSAQVVQEIQSRYTTMPWGAKLTAAEILGHIKLPQAEAAAARLLAKEQDATARTFLAMALCELATTDSAAIQQLTDMVQASAWDTSTTDLAEDVTVLCRMIGREPPKFDSEASRRHQFNAPAESLDWSDDADDELQPVVPTAAFSTEAPRPAPAARAPIRRDSAKVGRNDPCPCGSGKKYKKCCGG